MITDLIEPLSWGLWYANTERITLEATSAGGRVSMATLNAGGSVKERMLKVADYILSDQPTAAREITDIRSGTGHTDLATDLTRLAKLYDAHAATLADDGGKHYRAEDSTEAKRLAGPSTRRPHGGPTGRSSCR